LEARLTGLVHLEWFTEELAELRRCPAVTVRIHITDTKIRSTSLPRITALPPIADVTMGSYRFSAQDTLPYPEKEALEKSKVEITTRTSSFDEQFYHGRPDVDAIVARAVSSRDMTPDKRVFIAACAPSDFVADVRFAAASNMKRGSPGIDLHIEEFGL